MRISAGRPASAEDIAAMVREIRRAALAGDHIDHVYAQPAGTGVELVLFLLAGHLEAAEAAAREVLSRGLAGAAPGFRVLSCAVDLIVPVAEALLDPDP